MFFSLVSCNFLAMHDITLYGVIYFSDWANFFSNSRNSKCFSQSINCDYLLNTTTFSHSKSEQVWKEDTSVSSHFFMPRKAVLDSMEQSAVSNSFLFQCSRLLADLKRLSEFKDTKDKVDPYPLFQLQIFGFCWSARIYEILLKFCSDSWRLQKLRLSCLLNILKSIIATITNWWWFSVGICKYKAGF